MAHNKNQHFVPQFYLRNFAADPDRKSVNLLNLSRAKLIERASIRNQCSRDYWHGEYDEAFEESIKKLEGLSASIIKACLLTDEIQRLRHLKTFLSFQLGRTAFAAEAFAESRAKMYELAYRQPANENKVDPVHMIALQALGAPILLDLAACFVVNKSPVEFVTSDNPVALSNWWFRHIHRQRPGSGIGLAQAGLEVYFPLSPRHQLVLYDRNIWSVPKANSVGTIYLRNKDDVAALNERQVLNAQHNVYFASVDTAEHVLALLQACRERRRAEKVRVTEWVPSKAHPRRFVQPGTSEAAVTETRSSLISTEANAIEPARRVTLFSKRHVPRYDEHPSVAGAFRDLAWLQIVEDFRDAVHKRKAQLSDLDDFAGAHPLMHKVRAWKYEFWDEVKVARASRS
ncbi:MAG: DUF4238 domain-containing protein [Hyphomicrobiaceae bacterium]|nr:MAG: DUF4238 domain-containing protein [Hyphomicrobiaceae bacterium]